MGVQIAPREGAILEWIWGGPIVTNREDAASAIPSARPVPLNGFGIFCSDDNSRRLLCCGFSDSWSA